MPRPAKVINAFPPSKAAELVGMTIHMLNYLARERYLVPTYGRSGTRGRTRYYSYRDLVVARLVGDLLRAGLELSRLKTGLAKMQAHSGWTEGEPAKSLGLLVTDGSSLFFTDGEGTLTDLTARGQLAFAFVLDVNRAVDEIKSRLSPQELQHYDLVNRRRIAA